LSTKFTDHKCTSKGVFLLELDNVMEECEVAYDMDISLHALTGIDVGNTMNLCIIINGAPLLALVDTGSTHSFIQETVMFHLSL
jgi:hypothetical protein